jgi:sucrose-6-phosphate hydrolase SacC (GH32 family)
LDFKNLIGSGWTPGQLLDNSPLPSRKESDTTPRNLDTNQGPIIATPIMESTQIQEDKNQRSATKGESAKKDKELEKENDRIERVALEKLEKDRVRKAKLDKQAKLDLEKKEKLDSERKTQEAAQLQELALRRELQLKREVERQQEVLRQKMLQQETKAKLAEQKQLREKRKKEKLA